MSAPTAAEIQTLTQWDTPTICNALEIVAPERRGYGYTTEPLVALDPDLPPICGHARTATIRAEQPTSRPDAEIAELRLSYYEYVASQPGPTIAVIQDLDPVPGFGAFWGEVQTNIHKGLGVLGAVTNGSFRDVTDSAPGFSLFGGKVGPSHAFVHLVDIKQQVTIYGLTVAHNDIIHADRHGAVMVPADAVAKLPAAIDLIARREAVTIQAAQADGFNFEKLKQAMAGAKEIH
jgi:regulator of RNase E activity RraA